MVITIISETFIFENEIILSKSTSILRKSNPNKNSSILKIISENTTILKCNDNIGSTTKSRANYIKGRELYQVLE